MDVDGLGVIQHIWLVADPARGRSHILRFYWDGEDTPSIEVPVSDFFAVGHNKFAPVNSLAVIVNPRSAFNCYWGDWRRAWYSYLPSRTGSTACPAWPSGTR